MYTIFNEGRQGGGKSKVGRFWWICALMMFRSLCADPSEGLQWDQLAAYAEQGDPSLQQLIGHPVEIRGFLYRDTSGTRVLSKEPHLRSCCVGSQGRRTSQIFLDGLNEEAGEGVQAVTVAGKLYVESEGEELLPRYRLSNAQIVRRAGPIPIATLSVLGGLFLGGCFYGIWLWKRGKKPGRRSSSPA